MTQGDTGVDPKDRSQEQPVIPVVSNLDAWTPSKETCEAVINFCKIPEQRINQGIPTNGY